MTSIPFNMKFTQQDEKLLTLLMAKHKVQTKADLVRRALAFFEKAPVAVDPMATALANLERFEADEAQIKRHRAVKKAVEAGTAKGLDRGESLALLDKLQAGAAGKAKAGSEARSKRI